MDKSPTFPVTVAAVLKRINRKLIKDLRQLRKNRRGPYAESLPEWLEIDLFRNAIIGGTDDLEEFARELGVLAKWESVPD
jgi:hypothetical protein